MNNEIGKSLKKINNLLKRNHPEGCIHMHRLRGWTIGYLTENTGRDVYQKDLEAEFCVRRSTATAVLKLMERDGLIERTPVDGDKRLKKITLTPKAIECRTEFESRRNKLDEVMSEGISEEEQLIFKDITERIVNNLQRFFEGNKEHNQ